MRSWVNFNARRKSKSNQLKEREKRHDAVGTGQGASLPEFKLQGEQFEEEARGMQNQEAEERSEARASMEIKKQK
ncbi:hypothetical protein V6N12_003433 [Hibiscus sabdariffa]|uniref:Uncharacterized protein n=1 Tax=Hibiscus sabdariffa TaxID=183260 RepID=A0ABR2AQU1_9ROSI